MVRDAGRLVSLAAITAFLFFTHTGAGLSQLDTIQLAPHTAIVQNGAAGGGDWLNIPLGDVGGIRNIQCGKVTGRPEDLNCDIAGGDATHRGNVIINWDLGKCVAVFNGHKLPEAVICAGKRPWFRAKPRIGGKPPAIGAIG